MADWRVYVASSWEMSFFAPHSMATIVELMGGNDTFISRVYVHLNRLMTRAKKAHFCVYIRDHYFDAGYFDAGNEPGFEMPWAYHYANRPDLSALRVRKVVFENFDTGINGVSSPCPSEDHW